ncbi:GNAT family N-acetyltransferase [Microlunatus speluncae]|uniref:GNAT family N-acetyltransferase n=1 Tax=Microlunatus speluncae TaxID=2594267 RepID=UPI0012668077|nr:GNAT family protein [Microlunatus speluncae]
MTSALLLGRYDIRLPRLSDAEALAAAYDQNRDHLAPFEPRRSTSFYTIEGQRESLGTALETAQRDQAASWLIFDEERIVGQMNLNSIVLGAAHCAHAGYWIDGDYTGQGLASAALEFACATAVDLGLHRIEAATLVDNVASKAVLRRCGFTPIGRAPAYLHIDGAWRDHDLFQRVLHDNPPG